MCLELLHLPITINQYLDHPLPSLTANKKCDETQADHLLLPLVNQKEKNSQTQAPTFVALVDCEEGKDSGTTPVALKNAQQDLCCPHCEAQQRTGTHLLCSKHARMECWCADTS